MIISLKWVYAPVVSAIICFQPVHALAQQTASDFYKVTVNALKYNDYDNAILFANKALDLNPDYGAVYWNRAIAYENKDSFRLSLKDYNRALTYFDDSTDQATLYKNIGMVYNDMRNSDTAIQFFNKALTIKPRYALAYWNRGIAYDGDNEYGLAIKDYTRALELSTSDKDKEALYILRGTAYFKIKDIPKANADFRLVLKLDTAADYQAAYAKYFTESADSAKSVIRKFIIVARNKGGTEFATSYFNAACLFSMMTNREKAMSCLEMCLDLGFKNYHSITTSRDLDFIRGDQAFADLIAKYKTKK